ncbi:MAG: hypothetical protein ACOYNZ_05555 [Rhodoferax sp.]
MECTVGDFCIQINGHTVKGDFEAVVLIAENRKWQLVRCNPDAVWPKGTARAGSWEEDSALSHFYPQENLRGEWLFALGGIKFPPTLTDGSYSFTSNFGLRHGSGSWSPIVSGRLMIAAEKELEQIRKEMAQCAIDFKISVVTMLDPTGIASLPAARYALGEGDYLGCTMYLLGAVPLLGEFIKVPKVGLRLERIREFQQRLQKLQQLLERSLKTTMNTGLTNKVLRRGRPLPAHLRNAATFESEFASAERIIKCASNDAEAANLANRGGMLVKDAINARNFCASKDKFLITRVTARESAIRHGDMLNTGKESWMIDFHTAGDKSSYHGYIVVKKEQLGSKCYIDPKTGIMHPNGHPDYIVSTKKCPITGDRLITKDDVAFYSDYDFMGIYERDGMPFRMFEILTDNPMLTTMMNRLFPDFGRKMQHGMQDFWKVYKRISGRLVAKMGRQPGLDEWFLVFSPNGKVQLLHLDDLKSFYLKHNIRWPYDY